jgi:hypothetical protein
MKLINPCLSLVIVSFLLVGCRDTPRNLKVTEVAAHQVELFLDEPSTNAPLGVDPLKLRWISQDPGGQPVVGEVSLAGAGPLHGRQFLVIFEDPNHTGPPVGQNYRPAIPGLKVRGGTFPNYTTGTSASMSVFGRSPRGLFFIRLTTDVVDDIVSFGPHPRPRLPGEFDEDGTLDGVRPEGNRESVSRRFSGGDPRDTDRESDWSLELTSIGVANLPPATPTPTPP